MSLKNPVTPPGIDPRTLRLVAQRLNQYATPSPIYIYVCVCVCVCVCVWFKSYCVLFLVSITDYKNNSKDCNITNLKFCVLLLGPVG
jgi:hypothetical protein